jgi:putative RecB family exonuclease
LAEHRSVSQFNKYTQCSEEYRLSYVDKPNSSWAPAAWLAQGSAFHEAVQGWEESGRSPQFDIGRAYVVSYDRQIEEFKAREPDLKKWLKAPKTTTEDDIDNRRAKGLQQLQNYVDYAEENDFVVADIDEWTLAIEVPFELRLGDIVIKGAIDQILMHPTGYEVRDLKTGNRESAMLQLALYKVAVEKILGWPVIKASYFYAKDKKVVTLETGQLERYTEDYLTELFTTLDEGIKSRIFLPNPGGHCMLCPVRKHCREMGTEPMGLTENSRPITKRGTS